MSSRAQTGIESAVEKNRLNLLKFLHENTPLEEALRPSQIATVIGMALGAGVSIGQIAGGMKVPVHTVHEYLHNGFGGLDEQNRLMVEIRNLCFLD